MKAYDLWRTEGATKIEWYEPTEKKTDSAVLIFPGGGYYTLCDYEGKDYAEYLNSLGITAFVVYYRCTPNYFPLPLLDARRSVRFVRAHATEFGIDEKKILVMGSSAGGHLCALLSTYHKPIDGEIADEIDGFDYLPNGQVLCYGLISADDGITNKWCIENLLGQDYAKKEEISVELLVSEKTPKAFLWQTAEDTSVVVEHSLRYAAALSKKGVPCELHIFPYGAHGRALAVNEPHVAQWKTLFINWLTLNGWL